MRTKDRQHGGEPSLKQPGRTPFITGFIAAAITIAGTGYLSFHSFAKHHRRVVAENLATTADFKVHDLAQFRQERLGDAAVLFNNTALGTTVRSFLQSPDKPATREHLDAWLRQYESHYQYERAYLFDATGATRLVEPANAIPISGHLQRAVATSIQRLEIQFLDFYRDEHDGKAYLAIIVPIIDPAEANHALGAIALIINPESYLYPFIQRWPTSSPTAETLLVRRDGEKVVFLNPLRFQPDAALMLSFPLANTTLPAAQAVLGRDGIVVGVDYRGTQVLACVRPVPDAPWYLVARVDTAELDAPLRQRAWGLVGLTSLFLLTAASILRILWLRRQTRHLRELAASAARLQATNENLDVTLRSIGDGVITTGIDGRITRMNPVAEALTGWPLASALGQHLGTVYRLLEVAPGPTQDQPAEPEGPGLTTGKLLIARGGCEHRIADTVSPIRNRNGTILGEVLVFHDITEEHTLRETALQREADFRELFDDAPVAYHEIGPEGRILRINATELDLLGYTAEEMIGRPVWEFNSEPEDSRRATLEKLAGHREPGPAYERVLRRKDGRPVTVLVDDRVIFDPQGRVRLIRTTLQDITARKLAEDELRESQAFRQRVFDSSTIPIVIMDAETTRVLDCNPAAAAIYRLGSREGVLGKTPADVSAPVQYDGTPSAEKARTYIAQAQAEGQVTFEWLHCRPDGERWDGEVRLMSFTAGGRQLLQFTLLDITEQKRIESALHRSEALFRRTFDEAPVGAAIVAPDGSFKRVNSFLCQFLGYSPEELTGRRFVEITHPDDIPRSRELVRQLLLGTIVPFDQEKRYVRKDGSSVWGRVSVGLVRTPAGEPLHLVPIIQDINARKQAEEALRESEERLRITLETTQIGIWDWDVKNDRWTASPTYYTMLGYPPESGPQDRTVWIERVHPADRAMVGERIANVLNGSAHSYEYEARLKHADGSYFWQLVRGDAVAREPDGRPIRLVGTRMDINARRLAEEALRQKSALLEAQIDATIDGILVVDDQGKKLIQNRRMIELWKIPPEIANDPDDQTQIRHVMRKTREPEQFAAQVANLYEHPLETTRDEVELTDGTVLDRYSAPVLGANGHYYGRIWTFRDISERKAAEQSLRESEEKFSKVFHDAPVLIAITDPKNGEYIDINDEALRALGSSREEVIGRTGVELGWITQEQQTSLTTLLQEHGRIADLELVMRTRSGKRLIGLVSGEPIAIAGKACLLTVTSDISERRRNEEEVYQSLREKEALLKEVHHRVKNNLQIISSLLRLQAGQTESAAASEVLHDMQGRIQSMALLHETLYRSGNLAQIDLAGYVETISRQILRAQLRRSSDVHLVFDLTPVLLDATRAVPCGLLVNELVANCLKHAFPEGRSGTIQVRLRPAPEKAPAGLPGWELSVTDDGVGFPPALNVKELRSLGLQLVSDLSRQLQGTMATASADHGGASVTITFPLPPFHQPPAPPPSRP